MISFSKAIILVLCTSLAASRSVQDDQDVNSAHKDPFYKSEYFQSAMTGEASTVSQSHYTMAKIEVDSKDKLIVFTASILQDRYLMSDRRGLKFKVVGNNYKEALLKSDNSTVIVVEGKVSDVMDATVPVEYRDCTFEYLFLDASEKTLKFKLKGIKNCSDEWTFNLDFVEFVRVYYMYMTGFAVLAMLQILAYRIMIFRVREDFDTYMRKISMFGLLIDATMNSSIMYHFGVLLPIDIRVVIPQIVLMINSSFFWMQKLVHNVNRNPDRPGSKLFQFICTIIMMIGGLYIPSIDARSYSFLIAAVAPLGFQIYNSFENRVVSFTWEYNMLFKVPQLLTVCYIYGWPGHAAHLLPTYPITALKAIIFFVILSVVSYLQKCVHPRFYIKTTEDYKRMQLQPKKLLCQELINEDQPKIECAICLVEMSETPTEPALLTTCGHTFHENCLIHWLGRNETCPVCRKQVTHPDENYISAN